MTNCALWDIRTRDIFPQPWGLAPTGTRTHSLVAAGRLAPSPALLSWSEVGQLVEIRIGSSDTVNAAAWDIVWSGLEPATLPEQSCCALQLSLILTTSSRITAPETMVPIDATAELALELHILRQLYAVLMSINFRHCHCTYSNFKFERHYSDYLTYFSTGVNAEGTFTPGDFSLLL